MANKRTLKKVVNNVIYDIVEECFSAQLYNSGKTEACNAVIDEAAGLQDNLLSRISQAKSKADFKAIIADFEAQTEALYDKASKI